ncbi:MAG TPA: sulfatase, partial [Vicinamibacterales bacterium]|nr:sulfatase [Vicinamibacterales bacterium]
MPLPRIRLFTLVGVHLLVSAAVEGVFAWQFGHSPRVVVSHLLLIAEWDAALAAVCGLWPALSHRGGRIGRRLFLTIFSIAGTLQVFLYALDAVSNLSWGRNVTAHLVVAFAPTVWSGREPFPIAATGLTTLGVGTLIVIAGIVGWWGRDRGEVGPSMRAGLVPRVAFAAALVALVAATLHHGIADRDNLLWKDEVVTSFFRPDGYAFEPTARRYAVEERDAVLQASYPRRVPTALRKNVILIIVDSLRADHMQVYGYRRPTTPFLAQLVASGRMLKVENAFSTCSESFCGITSTLTGREFRDISARTFDLQDVLRDEGYRTWFLLSGNHSGWNGLPDFYHADEGTFFDGTHTRKYTMDDDRLVLEGLDRVPAASPSQPAFFYIHLMSTHYLGVRFPESHVFSPPDAESSGAYEPYESLVRHLDTPDRYDDKVLQADGMIHQVFDALAAKHYLDDALVVVTGDHGEGLGERHWAHGWNLYDEDIRIPLLLYDTPAARGARVPPSYVGRVAPSYVGRVPPKADPPLYPDLSFATQIDIAPTIVDRLGLPVPASWEGQSLLSPTRTRFTYHQTYFLPNRFAVVYRDGASLFKFIATPQYGKEELYDL